MQITENEKRRHKTYRWRWAFLPLRFVVRFGGRVVDPPDAETDEHSPDHGRIDLEESQRSLVDGRYHHQ